jgi:hypothetical protein
MILQPHAGNHSVNNRYSRFRTSKLLFLFCCFLLSGYTSMAQICNPPSVYMQPGNASGCEGSNVSFGTAGAFATGYQWQVDTGSGFVNLVNDSHYADVTLNSMSIYNLTPAMDGYIFRAIILGDSPTCYSVSVSAVLHVAQISATAVLTNPTCFGGTNGLIDLTVSGGSGIYGYYWPSTGWVEEPDLMNAPAGTHTVTIGDDQGCYGAATFTLTQPSEINVSGVAQGNPYCHGMTNGYAQVSSFGGTGTHTYLWSPSGQTGTTATGLGGGVHTVTVTDAIGCTKTMSFNIVEPQPLQATVTTTDVSCNGMTNGMASVIATGGPANFSYNYQWQGVGAGYSSINGLAAGNYNVLVYAGMCSTSQPFTINQPVALTSELTSFTNIHCNNASDGMAIVTGNGGTGNYTFDWSTSSEITGHATDLPAGTTEVTITDERGCTSMQSFVLTEPSPLALVIDSVHAATCFDASNGALYITATGGSPYITSGLQFYSVTMPPLPATANSVQYFQPSSTSEHLTGLTPGSYEFTFHDVNGCSATITVPVSAPDSIALTVVSLENVSCFGLSDGSAEVAATGGVGNLTFSSDSGTISPMIDLLPAGDFTVYATDENNCSSQYILTISEPAQLAADSVVNDVSCYGGSNGAIDLTTAGGTAPYTFEWDDNSTSEDRTGLTAGIYSVTISDDHDCSVTITSSVSQPSEMVSSFSAANCDSYTWNAQTYTTSGLYTHVFTSANGCDSTVTLNLTITNGTTGSANQTACNSITLNGQTYVTSGTYIQHLTNAAGCDSTLTLNLTISTMEMTALDNNDGSITASSANGYQWIDCATGNGIPGANSQTFTATLNGTYAVAGTSNSGCSDTSACVTINYLGVAEHSLSAITIAPNPTQNLVTVQFDELTANVTIRDAQGKSLAFQNIVSGEQISLINYPAGVYFFEFATAKGVTTKRIVKN